jgi:hypothetical protein
MMEGLPDEILWETLQLRAHKPGWQWQSAGHDFVCHSFGVRSRHFRIVVTVQLYLKVPPGFVRGRPRPRAGERGSAEPDAEIAVAE